jgi:hypothetical protein
LLAASDGFDDGGRVGQRDQLAAIEQSNQGGAVDAGEWPLPIAAEKLERAPAARGGAVHPAVAQQGAIGGNEPNPPLERPVGWRAPPDRAGASLPSRRVKQHCHWQE